MHKTLLLLTLPTLLPACLEPNRMNLGGSEDETDTEAMPAADETGGDDMDDPDDPDDPDDDEASGDESSGGDETDGGEGGFPGPNCDLETHECISNVPAGWNGPVANVDAANLNGCQGTYSELAFESYQAVVADPAACTCECGPAQGGSCAEQVVVELYPRATVPDGATYNASSCQDQLAPDVVPPTADEVAAAIENDPNSDGGLYYPTDWENYDVRFIADPPAVATPGTCGVATESTELGEPELIGAQLACAPATPFNSCDAATLCVPKQEVPFEAGLCIWAEGDQACPAGTDFVNREVRSTGVVDNRTCSSCSCGAVIGQSCDDAELTFWQTAPFLWTTDTFPVDGTCTFVDLNAGESWFGISLEPGDPSGGACTEQGGNPQGGVQPESQITLCCS
jgi:hypothetical protein